MPEPEPKRGPVLIPNWPLSSQYRIWRALRVQAQIHRYVSRCMTLALLHIDTIHPMHAYSGKAKTFMRTAQYVAAQRSTTQAEHNTTQHKHRRIRYFFQKVLMYDGL
jgi:hypothetical protein